MTNLLLANEDGTRGGSGERGHCYTKDGMYKKRRDDFGQDENAGMS